MGFLGGISSFPHDPERGEEEEVFRTEVVAQEEVLGGGPVGVVGDGGVGGGVEEPPSCAADCVVGVGRRRRGIAGRGGEADHHEQDSNAHYRHRCSVGHCSVSSLSVLLLRLVCV